MLEQSTAVLHVAPIDQEPGQQVSIFGVPRYTIRPSQHRATHEHILDAEIGVARRRRLARPTLHESVRRVEKQPAICLVSGVVGQPCRPDYAGQRSATALCQVCARVGSDVRYQFRDLTRRALPHVIQFLQPQPAADADALSVVHRVQGVPISTGKNAAYLQRRPLPPRLQRRPAGRRRQVCVLPGNRPQLPQRVSQASPVSTAGIIPGASWAG